jgi:Domain of unknown function (DUF1918)
MQFILIPLGARAPQGAGPFLPSTAPATAGDTLLHAGVRSRSIERRRMAMAFEVGKRVVAESESTDRRPRAGVVQEVLRDDPSPRYRIRWDDGHESIYTPASGALRAGRGRRPRQAAPRKRSPG